MKQVTLNISLFCVLIFSHSVLAGRVVSRADQFPQAAALACDGKYVGADCMIEFAGGHVGFGLCIEVPNGGGELTCNIDLSQIPASCRNNALSTKGSLLTFGALAIGLFFLRRRKV